MPGDPKSEEIERQGEQKCAQGQNEVPQKTARGSTKVSQKEPTGRPKGIKEGFRGIRWRVPGPKFLCAGVVLEPLWVGKGRPLSRFF